MATAVKLLETAAAATAVGAFAPRAVAADTDDGVVGAPMPAIIAFGDCTLLAILRIAAPPWSLDMPSGISAAIARSSNDPAGSGIASST